MYEKKREVLCLAHCAQYIIVSPVKGTLLSLNFNFKQTQFPQIRRGILLKCSSSLLTLTQCIIGRTIKTGKCISLLLRGAIWGQFEFWAIGHSLCLCMCLSRSLGLGAESGERARDKLSGVLSADSVSLTIAFKICHVFPGLPQTLSIPSAQGTAA